MNKFICFAFVVFACIASGTCNYGNLAKLAMGSYNNPASSAASSSAAAADAPSYSAPAASYPAHSGSYHTPSYHHSPSYHHGSGYTAAAYNAPSYSAPMKSYAPKYSVHPAYATEMYHGQQNYKTYNSPPHYSQMALPIIPSAPVAKLYVPNDHSYDSHSYNSRY